MTKTNTRLLFSILVVLSTLLFYTGCVDTGVQNIDSSFDFHSEVSVANLVENGGAATISIDDQQFGAVSVGATTSDSDLQSGNKSMLVSFAASGFGNETFSITVDTEKKIRFYIVSDGTEQSIIKDVQRYTWQTSDSEEGEGIFTDSTAQVAIFNASPDLEVEALMVVANGDTSYIEFDDPIATESRCSYFSLATTSSVNYSLGIIYDDAIYATVPLTAEPRSRYTVAVYGSATEVDENTMTVKYSVFTDD